MPKVLSVEPVSTMTTSCTYGAADRMHRSMLSASLRTIIASAIRCGTRSALLDGHGDADAAGRGEVDVRAGARHKVEGQRARAVGDDARGVDRRGAIRGDAGMHVDGLARE